MLFSIPLPRHSLCPKTIELSSSQTTYYASIEITHTALQMSRFSRYDSDEERLPEGMTRVGYDADTQVSTFQDEDGSYWESAPGNAYGRLFRVSDGPAPDDDDMEPFIVSDQSQKPSWRADVMPLLNFGVIVGVSLMLLFWYLHYAASSGSSDDTASAEKICPDGTEPYTVQGGDSCWDLGDSRGISVDDVVNFNAGLACDNLKAKSKICLPPLPGPV